MDYSENNGISLGFSKRSDNPEILKGARKFERIVIIIMLILTAIPISVCAVLENGKYLIIGAILSSIFLFALVFRECKRLIQKPFEGIVTDKYVKEKYYTSKNENFISRTRKIIYYLRIKTNDGKELIRKLDNDRFYNYLNIGDKVRFHPKLNGYYEKYDKSHDEYLICPSCLGENSPKNDRCTHCNVPILK